MKIGIIGPIASGKSTLARILSNKYNLPLVEETVEENIFLPLFYKEKSTFAIFSQHAFYGSLFYNLYQMKDQAGYIADTTLYSNLVFSHLMVDEGILSQDELNSIKVLGKKHLSVLGECDLYIIIKRSKQALFRNWKRRNRSIEKDQETYLDYHYSHYYKKLEEIFKIYQVNPDKVFTIDDVDFMNVKDLNCLLKNLEDVIGRRK
jgi:deoxyadenosine/deoxycytidine kinase